MEIERKYLKTRLPEDLKDYPCRIIEQGYLNIDPVIRIRRDNEKYELTYKSKGLMTREEYNLPLSREAYVHLMSKIDGRLIRKKRYMIPLAPRPAGEKADSGQAFYAGSPLTVELDIFEEDLAPLILAEVEFPDEASALSFTPPEWFGEDVTFSGQYHNSYLSRNLPQKNRRGNLRPL